jgi:hypothetical protein
LISEWRKQRDRDALEALQGKQRGPKVDRVAAENKRLREQVAHLEKRLGTAEALIEAQGNAFTQKKVRSFSLRSERCARTLQALSRKSEEVR